VTTPAVIDRRHSSESFVLFELAGNTCGLRSQAVQSVEMVEHVTAVPNALPFVEGLTFTRGQVIPSINLRIRFGFPRIPVDPRARMLVVRSKERTAGMLVDSAREFVSIPADAIQPPGETDNFKNSGFSVRYVEGIATLGNRSVLILNLEEVIEGV
jgi:purine-binding chemotaxis protein CheW